jgi:hypothetical protein
MSLSTLRFWPRRGPDEARSAKATRAAKTKYRRSAMENRGRLQCKVLQRQEKRRRHKNNGYQWKSNAKNNGNNEKNKRA